MAIRPLVIYPDPRLREQSHKVDDPEDESIRQLVDDMADTMYAHNGAGLAAIQIGVPLEVFLVDAPIAGKTEKDPPLVFINPQPAVLGEEKETAEEGCLSFPDIFVPVSRSLEVTFRAMDLEAQVFEISGEGLFARAMQHEYDHLTGDLIVDFVGRIKKQLIRRKLKKTAR